MRSGGADVGMVTCAAAEVEPNEDFAPGEALLPVEERMQAVERQMDAGFERLFVLAAGSEIRREQNAVRRHLGATLEHALDLARRDAFEAESERGEAAEDLRVGVRLHRIEKAIEDAERG